MGTTIVVGGGVSGLATAFACLLRDPGAKVLVLESEARLGGNVRTLRERGAVVDLGPDALLASRAEAAALCDALGLGAGLIAPTPAGRHVLVPAGERLVPLPEGLVFGVPTRLSQLVSTPLLTWRGKLRAALDLVLPANDRDATSVGELVERRLGREVKDRLVEPLVGAVYAADVDRLDAAVGLPFAAAARGSLVRALARAPKPAGSPLRAPPGGMEALIEALAARIGPARIRTGAGVARVRALAHGWELRTTAGERMACDDLVLAVPPHQAAAMLAGDRELAVAAGDIQATSTATVVLAFPAGTEVPDASGVLVPRTEGRALLAATFVDRKWSRPSPSGEVIVRAFLGGARSPRLVETSDDATLVALALADLRAWVKLPEPSWTRIARFVRATPQPAPGHRERVAHLRGLVAARPGLHLVGAAYEGPGIAGCAAQAARVAAAISDR